MSDKNDLVKEENAHFVLDAKLENISFNIYDKISTKPLIIEIVRSFTVDIKLKHYFYIQKCFICFYIDAIYLNISKTIINLIQVLSNSIDQYKKIIFDDLYYSKNTNSSFDLNSRLHTETLKQQHYEIKEDDTRNNDFYYLINNNSEAFNLHRMELPEINQIIINEHNLNDYKDLSSICWKYKEMRSIVFASIQPLSFSYTINLKTNDTQSLDYLKDPNCKVKCYLECLNECTNSFEVVKEFYIHDGQFTTIID